MNDIRRVINVEYKCLLVDNDEKSCLFLQFKTTIMKNYVIDILNI